MTAGRGIAMLITGGQITTVTSAPYKTLATGLLARAAGRGAHRRVLLRRHRARHAAHGARRAHRVRRHQPGRPPGWRACGPGRSSGPSTSCARCSPCVAGFIRSSDIMAADANNAGLFIELDAILAVVIGGTSLAGGKFSLSGTLVGRARDHHADALGHRSSASPSTRSPCSRRSSSSLVCLLQSPVVRHKLRARRRSRRPRSRGGAGLMATDQLTSPTAPTDARPSFGSARPQAPASTERYLPVLGTVVVLVAHAGHRRLPVRELPHRPRHGQPAHQQLVPRGDRGRHDVRDPHRRHRPVGRRGRRAVRLRRGVDVHARLAAPRSRSPRSILVGTVIGLARRGDGARVRDTTLHRDPGGDVPGPRPLLRRRAGVDPDHRPDDRRARPDPLGHRRRPGASRRAASSRWPSWPSRS